MVTGTGSIDLIAASEKEKKNTKRWVRASTGLRVDEETGKKKGKYKKEQKDPK